MRATPVKIELNDVTASQREAVKLRARKSQTNGRGSGNRVTIAKRWKKDERKGLTGFMYTIVRQRPARENALSLNKRGRITPRAETTRGWRKRRDEESGKERKREKEKQRKEGSGEKEREGKRDR